MTKLRRFSLGKHDDEAIRVPRDDGPFCLADEAEEELARVKGFNNNGRTFNQRLMEQAAVDRNKLWDLIQACEHALADLRGEEYGLLLAAVKKAKAK